MNYTTKSEIYTTRSCPIKPSLRGLAENMTRSIIMSLDWLTFLIIIPLTFGYAQLSVFVALRLNSSHLIVFSLEIDNFIIACHLE